MTDTECFNESPYVHEVPMESDTSIEFNHKHRPMIEQFYNEKEVELITRILSDRTTHMKHILKLYKFMISSAKARKKAIYEKTEEDVLKEITDTKGYSLNMESLASNVSQNIAESMFNTDLFHKQLDCIPVFLDFAYMYYVRYYSDDSPVLKLPTFMPKFHMIMSVLKAPQDDLQACFEQCIENSIIADMRQQVPPYYLRTDLNEEEIREKMKIIVLPLFKDIITHLLQLGKTKKIKISDSEIYANVVIDARPDNIDVQDNCRDIQDNCRDIMN